MSRKPVKNDPRLLDELALFRDAAETTETAMFEAEPVEPAANDADLDGDTSNLDEALQALDDAPVAALPISPRERSASAATPLPTAVHGVWIGVGVGMALLGILLAIAAAARPAGLEPLLDAISRLGMSPTLLLGFGVATWGIGVVLGRLYWHNELLAQCDGQLHDILAVVDSVDATTHALHDADASRAANAMSGDEAGQVLFALQRHEEKLANLTRATKTFGKPLVEMTTQLADVAAQIAQGQASIQAVRVATEGGLNRLEEMLVKQAESGTSGSTDQMRNVLEELRTGLQGKLEGVARDLAKTGPDAIQRHLATLSGQLDGKLAANGQKVCDNLSKELATRLAELSKGAREDGVNLTPVLNGIAELRRDLVKLGGGLASSSSSSRPPQVSAPAPTVADSKPTADEPPASGLAQSIAGERSAKAGNVLGAIAKLKKMRS